MKLEGRKCRVKNCKTRIIGEPMTIGEDSPSWIMKGIINGY